MPILKSVQNTFSRRLDSLLEAEEKSLKNLITGKGDPTLGVKTGKTPTEKFTAPAVFPEMSVIYYGEPGNMQKYLATPPENGISIVYGRNMEEAGILIDGNMMTGEGAMPPKALQNIAMDLYSPEEKQIDSERAKHAIAILNADPYNTEARNQLQKLGFAALPYILAAYNETKPAAPPPKEGLATPKKESPQLQLPSFIGKMLINVSGTLHLGEKDPPEEKALYSSINTLHSDPTKSEEFASIMKRISENPTKFGVTPEQITKAQELYNQFIKEVARPKPAAAATTPDLDKFLKFLKEKPKTEAAEKGDLNRVYRNIIESFSGINGILKIYEKLISGTPVEVQFNERVNSFRDEMTRIRNEYMADKSAATSLSPKHEAFAENKYQKNREIAQGKLIIDLLKMFREASKTVSLDAEPKEKELFSKMRKIVINMMLPLLTSKPENKFEAAIARKAEPKVSQTLEAPKIETYDLQQWITDLVSRGVFPEVVGKMNPEARKAYITNLLTGSEGPQWIEKLPGNLVSQVLGGSITSEGKIPFIFGPGYDDDRKKVKEKKDSETDIIIKRKMSKPLNDDGTSAYSAEEWLEILEKQADTRFILDPERLKVGSAGHESLRDVVMTLNGPGVEQETYFDAETKKKLSPEQVEKYTSEGLPFIKVKSNVDAKTGKSVPFSGTVQDALEYVLNKSQLSSMIYRGAVRISTEKGISELQRKMHVVGQYIPMYARNLPDPGSVVGYILKFQKVSENEWSRVQKYFDPQSDLYNILGTSRVRGPVFLRFEDYDPDKGEGARQVDAMIAQLKKTMDEIGGFVFEVVPTASPAPANVAYVSGVGPISKPETVKKPAEKEKEKKGGFKMIGKKLHFGPITGKSVHAGGAPATGLKQLLGVKEPEEIPVKKPVNKGHFSQVLPAPTRGTPAPRIEPRSGAPRGQEEEF